MSYMMYLSDLIHHVRAHLLYLKLPIESDAVAPVTIPESCMRSGKPGGTRRGKRMNKHVRFVHSRVSSNGN